MKPTHHPEADMLAAYAYGSLPEPPALLVASHLTFCPECRAGVAEFEAVGGALLEEMPVATADGGDLGRLLERRDRPAPADPERSAAAARGDARLPQPLRDYVGAELDNVEWRGRGKVRERRLLPQHGSFATRLLRIRAGAVLPRHTHGGAELTLVLTGGFADKYGHYCRGDVAIADASVDHQPIADAGEDCICLAVTDAPLRLTGFGGALLNLFIRN
jgi:putative transcriptional regulator